MKVRDIENALERVAPLCLQDDFDNAGLQVGLESDDVTAVLTCLDVTEDIIAEAFAKGCSLIVSHHPLLFHPLKRVSDFSYQQRCVRTAIQKGISIYSAHTNLDNASGGVNYCIAEKIGLQNLEWLEAKPGQNAGSGLIGTFREPVPTDEFLGMLKTVFGVEALRHSATVHGQISKVALCGGAGSFLMGTARGKGADCFITGEAHYHDYFENEGMLVATLGHYESEKFTTDLLAEIIAKAYPELRIEKTRICTNPITVR